MNPKYGPQNIMLQRNSCKAGVYMEPYSTTPTPFQVSHLCNPSSAPVPIPNRNPQQEKVSILPHVCAAPHTDVHRRGFADHQVEGDPLVQIPPQLRADPAADGEEVLPGAPAGNVAKTQQEQGEPRHQYSTMQGAVTRNPVSHTFPPLAHRPCSSNPPTGGGGVCTFPILQPPTRGCTCVCVCECVSVALFMCCECYMCYSICTYLHIIHRGWRAGGGGYVRVGKSSAGVPRVGRGAVAPPVQ